MSGATGRPTRAAVSTRSSVPTVVRFVAWRNRSVPPSPQTDGPCQQFFLAESTTLRALFRIVRFVEPVMNCRSRPLVGAPITVSP